MDQFKEALSSSDAIALIASALIFIVTVVLVARRLIGFLITLVLLFFALVAGLSIANNDIIRHYFSSEESSEDPVKDTMNRAYDHLKDDYEVLLQKIDDAFDKDSNQNGD